MKALVESPLSRRPPNELATTRPAVLKTILVATNLSEESYRALAYALLLAEHAGSEVHVVHVTDPEMEFLTPNELWHRLALETKRRCGRVLTREECEICVGRTAKEITAAAIELGADLIVTATHGHSGLKHFVLGSTAEKVLRHAPCPVLIVRDCLHPRALPRKILVPIDFSERAVAGADYARRFAEAFGADLHLMHVVVPPFAGVDGFVAAPEFTQVMETERAKAEEELEALIETVAPGRIAASSEVVTGGPVNALVDRTKAGDLDLVIASTHGDSGLRHALLGSVAEELVRGSACPVLVVPTFKHRVPEPQPLKDASVNIAELWRAPALGVACTIAAATAWLALGWLSVPLVALALVGFVALEALLGAVAFGEA